MTNIIIKDEYVDDIYMNIETEILELYPWVVLNLDEIGVAIAYQLFDAGYDITQEMIDEEINDYLYHIHERLLERAIQKLEENGVDVI